MSLREELIKYELKMYSETKGEAELQVDIYLNNSSQPEEEARGVQHQKAQKEDFLSMIDALLITAKLDSWASKTIEELERLRQKYD